MEKNNSGFTLIEIIVVLGISMLFLGMGIVGYSDFNEQKKLDGEVQKLASTLELIRKKVEVGNYTNYDCCDSYTLSISSNNSYLIKENCETGCAVGFEKSYSIPNNYGITILTHTPTLTFKKSTTEIITGAIYLKNIKDKCELVEVSYPGAISISKVACP